MGRSLAKSHRILLNNENKKAWKGLERLVFSVSNTINRLKKKEQNWYQGINQLKLITILISLWRCSDSLFSTVYPMEFCRFKMVLRLFRHSKMKICYHRIAYIKHFQNLRVFERKSQFLLENIRLCIEFMLQFGCIANTNGFIWFKILLWENINCIHK